MAETLRDCHVASLLAMTSFFLSFRGPTGPWESPRYGGNLTGLPRRFAPRNDKGADCHGVCVSSFKGTPYPYPSQMGIRTSCYFSQGQVGTGVDAHLSSSFPLSVRFTGKQNPCGCKFPVIATVACAPGNDKFTFDTSSVSQRTKLPASIPSIRRRDRLLPCFTDRS